MFHKLLKEAMTIRNMTQTELSIKSEVGKSSISQYLAGKNIPKDSVKMKLANALDLPDNYFFTEPEPTEEEYEANSRKVTIREAARRMCKSEQFVRVALQRGIATFGLAVKLSSKYGYHISPKLFDEYIGKLKEEEE